MILKVRDEGGFNLSMRLNINYDLEYIEVTVCAQNKKAHTAITRTFNAMNANNFRDALAYFRQEEAFLFGKKEN